MELSADRAGHRPAVYPRRSFAGAGPAAWRAAAALLSFLLILARIDARTQLLPDRLTLPLLWAGLLFNLNEVYIALPDAVAGAMAGYLALWSVLLAVPPADREEALGYGDFKLLAALGAWCGWQVLPQVLLLRFGQRAGCGPCCNACGPGSRCSSRWPSAPGWRWPAGVFFSGSRWSSVCEPTGRAGCRPAAAATSIFLLRRVGAALAGSSGQTCFG
ncbi:A24 family peptidase [Klebsiella pneumoniae subsp. pneumoniae]|nr:A24 family peptidase [Klebsiella pneumoniae subsp. pneumoniae]